MRSGYYLEGASPLVVIAFPVARRMGADDAHIERGNLKHTTERGREWIYGQFERVIYRLTFRLTAAQLAIFATLDAAVEGERVPFYFVPDIAGSPLAPIYVRKERDFRPQEMPLKVNAGEQFFEYVLELRQEPQGVEVAL